MSNTPRFTLALLLASTATAAAEPPKWCNNPDATKPKYVGTTEALRDDVIDALRGLVSATCWPDGSAPAHEKELAAARARWSKELGLTEDDWADVVVWASNGVSDLANPSFIFPDSDIAFSAYSPVQQFSAIDPGSGPSSREDAHYIADALGSRLTEVGRLGYIDTCLTGDVHATQWAMCEPDIAAFDRTKFYAQLRSDTKTTPFYRIALRTFEYTLRAKIEKHEAMVKELVAKDPGYAKMFEIAAAQRNVFATVDPALFEMANAMDDARHLHSKRAYAGCDEKVWPAWRAAVAAIPSSKFATASASSSETALSAVTQVIVQDPAGYLASIALFTCAGRDHSDRLLGALAGATAEWPGARGPRTAAASAIFVAGIEFDDRNAAVDEIVVSRPWQLRGETDGESGTGVVAKVKKTDAGATIEFKKTSRKELQCTSSKETNKIIALDTAGHFVYQKICLEERNVTVNTTPSPVTVDARYVDGLQPGSLVEVIDGAVSAVWSKPGAKTPSYVVGVKLK